MTETIRIGASMVNQHGILKPESYQQIITEVIEDWFFEKHIEVPHMISCYGLSWVFLSMTIDVDTPARAGNVIQLSLEGMHQQERIFRLDVQASQEGVVLFRSAVFASLLNMKTRRLCLPEEIPDAVKLTFGKTLLEAQSRPPVEEAPIMPKMTRLVYPSWVDELGHVNNSRYGEMAYDALSAEEQVQLKDVCRISIYFLQELHEGEVLVIYKSTNRQEFLVKGMKENGSPAFLYALSFTVNDTLPCCV